jgi:hypothetical protein
MTIRKVLVGYEGSSGATAVGFRSFPRRSVNWRTSSTLRDLPSARGDVRVTASLGKTARWVTRESSRPVLVSDEEHIVQ